MNPQKNDVQGRPQRCLVTPNAAAIDWGDPAHAAVKGRSCTWSHSAASGHFTAESRSAGRLVYGWASRPASWKSTRLLAFRFFRAFPSRTGILPCCLSNRARCQAVPGLKTDVSRCAVAAAAILLDCAGLLSPKGHIAELRLRASRERLLEYAASHIQHMQRSIDEMNLSAPPRFRPHHRDRSDWPFSSRESLPANAKETPDAAGGLAPLQLPLHCRTIAKARPHPG